MIESDCARAVDAIESLGDGEVGRVKLLFLKRHAGKCRKCGSYLNRMEAVIQALAGLERVTAPDDLVEAVMACLLSSAGAVERHAEAEEHSRRNLLLVAGATGLGVAVAVAVAVVRWVFGREHEEGLAPMSSA